MTVGIRLRARRTWFCVLLLALLGGCATARPRPSSAAGAEPGLRRATTESDSESAATDFLAERFSPTPVASASVDDGRRVFDFVDDIVEGHMARPDGAHLWVRRGELPPSSNQIPERLGEELWIIAKPDAEPVGHSEVPGCGELRTQQGEELVSLTLAHTHVEGSINGSIASVNVNQKYENPFNQTIEAVYVFPLPQNAAVSELVMVIGARRIRGIIREREQAEQIYHEALRLGLRVGLLQQQPGNVFSQRVANIAPHQQIDVRLTYYSTLPYRDGAYELVFPMVVGATGDGAETATERSGREVSMHWRLDAGMDIESVTSPSHAIETTDLGPRSRKVVLTKQSVVANRDFVLRYRVAGEGTKMGFLAHEDSRGGFFSLMLQPPAQLESIPRSAREMVFVLDCSNSMKGWALERAKRAIRRVLELMDPQDSFQIIRFSSSASQLGPEPIEASPRNIERGLRYLDSLSGNGEAEMLQGLQAALDFPHEAGKLRLVTFFTDGNIGNETQILSAVAGKLGASRLFSFGVGPQPNRYLLDRLAVMGNGAVAYVDRDDAAADVAVDAFFERIAYPALADIEVDWSGMDVSDVYPSRIPDLYHGRPVLIMGRYRGTPKGELLVRGRAGGKSVSFVVPLDAHSDRSRAALPQIWARMHIAELANQATFAPQVDELAKRIKLTALTFGLLSVHTAFVVVDATVEK